jgi:hypothetical protein
MRDFPAEALKRADLGDDRNGRQLGHAAHRLQRFDHGSLLRWRCRDRSIDREVEARQPFALVKDLRDAVAECDLLRLVLELEPLHPSPPRVRPRATVVRVTEPVPQQVLHEPVLRATLVLFRRRARAHQISQRLVRGIGHPHRRECAALVALGQLLRVAPVRLDLLARLSRNQRRRDDVAVDAHLRELPVQRVARRPGFVTDLQSLRAADLVDELPHRLRPIRELPQAPRFPVPLAHRGRDRLPVDIQPDVSCNLLHDRLLLCGSALGSSPRPP